MTEPEPAPVQPLRAPASPLREAVREARIEAAERTGLVVDLRDAELARLELVHEALGPVFADLPPEVDLFDRAVVPGAAPRLWIDMVAHVAMGRDKRVYRFLQDTRHGRRVLAESPKVEAVVEAVTRYVARRLVEREKALAGGEGDAAAAAPFRHRPAWWKTALVFLFGMAAGVATLAAVAWFVEPLI